MQQAVFWGYMLGARFIFLAIFILIMPISRYPMPCGERETGDRLRDGGELRRGTLFFLISPDSRFFSFSRFTAIPGMLWSPRFPRPGLSPDPAAWLLFLHALGPAEDERPRLSRRWARLGPRAGSLAAAAYSWGVVEMRWTCSPFHFQARVDTCNIPGIIVQRYTVSWGVALWGLAPARLGKTPYHRFWTI